MENRKAEAHPHPAIPATDASEDGLLVDALKDSIRAWRLLEKRRYMDGGRIPTDLIPSFCDHQATREEELLAALSAQPPKRATND